AVEAALAAVRAGAAAAPQEPAPTLWPDAMAQPPLASSGAASPAGSRPVFNPFAPPSVQGALALQQAALLYAKEAPPAWTPRPADAPAPAFDASADWPLGRAVAQIAGVYVLAEN